MSTPNEREIRGVVDRLTAAVGAGKDYLDQYRHDSTSQEANIALVELLGRLSKNVEAAGDELTTLTARHG